jgi:hypothetical protein
MPQLRAALKETSLFAEDTLVIELFQRMDTEQTGRVTWPDFLAAIQSFAASDEQSSASAEEQGAGSGTLGENIRLLLLAYGHRRHLQRQLGEAFAARYYSGPLSAERSPQPHGPEMTAQQRRASVRRQHSTRGGTSSTIDMREAERIAESAIELHPMAIAQAQRRGSTVQGPPRGGRRASIAPAPGGGTPGSSRQRQPRMSSTRMRRRQSLVEALEQTDGTSGKITTDEMLFGRRGSRAIARRGSRAPSSPGLEGTSNAQRDWTGLPEEVAAAILAADSGQPQDNLLQVMEETDRNFAWYMQTRPDDWDAKRIAFFDRSYTSRASRELTLSLRRRTSSRPITPSAGPLVGGKLVGRHAGRRLSPKSLWKAINWPSTRSKSPTPPPSLGSSSLSKPICAQSEIQMDAASEELRVGVQNAVPSTEIPPTSDSVSMSAAVADAPLPLSLDAALSDVSSDEDSDQPIDQQGWESKMSFTSDGHEDGATSILDDNPRDPGIMDQHVSDGVAEPQVWSQPSPLLAPLSTVLSLMSEIENVSSNSETLAALRRARTHAFAQERQFGGVRSELYRAVESIHNSMLSHNTTPRNMSEMHSLSSQASTAPNDPSSGLTHPSWSARAAIGGFASRSPMLRRAIHTAPGTARPKALSARPVPCSGGARGSSVLLKMYPPASAKTSPTADPFKAVAKRMQAEKQFKETAGKPDGVKVGTVATGPGGAGERVDVMLKNSAVAKLGGWRLKSTDAEVYNMGALQTKDEKRLGL